MRASEIARLEMRWEQQRVKAPPAPSPAAAPPKPDNLILIKGIGPVLNRRLNDLGVYTFLQIAEWSAADIERIGEALDTIPDRIPREEWQAQARKFHEDKYGQKALSSSSSGD